MNTRKIMLGAVLAGALLLGGIAIGSFAGAARVRMGMRQLYPPAAGPFAPAVPVAPGQPNGDLQPAPAPGAPNGPRQISPGVPGGQFGNGDGRSQRGFNNRGQRGMIRGAGRNNGRGGMLGGFFGFLGGILRLLFTLALLGGLFMLLWRFVFGRGGWDPMSGRPGWDGNLPPWADAMHRKMHAHMDKPAPATPDAAAPVMRDADAPPVVVPDVDAPDDTPVVHGTDAPSSTDDSAAAPVM